MFDPTIGRWISEDPSGIQPDEDLFRYCHNNPTTLIDPSGLEEEWATAEYIKLKEDKDTKVTLEDATFKDGDGWGTVSVWKDASVYTKANKTTTIDNLMVIQFKTTDTKIKGIHWHWMQFISVQRYSDTEGKDELVGQMIRLRDDAGALYVKTGKDNVVIDGAGGVFYDGHGTLYARVAGRVTMADSPSAASNAMGKSVWTVQTYLVNDQTGEVAYVVNWKRVGTKKGKEWTYEYEDVKGQKVDKLPAFVKQYKDGKILLKGYRDAQGKEEAREMMPTKLVPK